MKKRLISAVLTLCLLMGLCGAVPREAFAAKTFTAGNLRYQVVSESNGTCILIGGKNKNIKKIDLDTADLEGYDLVGIKKGAFRNYKKLKSVVINTDIDSYYRVSDNCFAGCTALTKVELDYQVKGIGKNAFKGCKKLGYVEIPTSSLKQSSFGANSFNGTKKGIKIAGYTKASAKRYAAYAKKCGAKNPKYYVVKFSSSEDDEDDE